jgi:hypothetical protein
MKACSLADVRNAFVVYFRGKLQLRIRGRGQLKVIEKGDPIKQPKKEEDS